MSETTTRACQSPAIGEIASALSQAQGEFTNPKKDRANPFFKSNYATLDALIDCTRKILTKNGLAVVQTLHNERGLELSTRLIHSSGQWIESSVPLMAAKDGPQKLGSEITYLRRYSYAAMLSICADEDDDGNQAQAQQPKKTAQAMPALAPAKPPPTALDSISAKLAKCLTAVDVLTVGEAWGAHKAKALEAGKPVTDLIAEACQAMISKKYNSLIDAGEPMKEAAE